MSNSAKKARSFAALSGGALVAAAPFVTTGTAHASTFTVSTLADTGAGSLRKAIDDANGTPGPDTITFQAGLSGTITLTSGTLYIDDDVSIEGPGATAVTVSGNDSNTVFVLYTYLDSLEVSISNLTISDGQASTGAGRGGAIWAYSTDLTLDGVTISNNAASSYGGGVFLDGESSFEMHDSTVSGNTGSYGAGIYFKSVSAGADIIIEDSVFSENVASQGAGALYFGSANPFDLDIERSTFSDNTAETYTAGAISLYAASGSNIVINASTFSGNAATGARSTGGALYVPGVYCDIAITNSTFSGNSAPFGGAIYVGSIDEPTATVSISHSTITGNSSTGDNGSRSGGGGVYLRDSGSGSLGDIELDHTVIAGNSSVRPGTDIATAGTAGFTGQWSMIGDLDGFALTGSDNLSEGDAMLGALANNGGSTKTHLPLPGSPLLNAGNPAFVSPPLTDQRGLARVSGGRIDVGAVEAQPELPATGGANGLMAAVGAALLGLGGALHLSGRRKRAA